MRGVFNCKRTLTSPPHPTPPHVENVCNYTYGLAPVSKNMMTQIDHEAKSFHLPIRYILIPYIYIYNCPIVSHIIPYLYTFIKPVVSHHYIYHPINEQLRIGGVKPSQAYQSMGVVFPVLSYHHSSHLSGSKSVIQKIFCAIIPSPLHHGSRLLIIVYN